MKGKCVSLGRTRKYVSNAAILGERWLVETVSSHSSSTSVSRAHDPKILLPTYDESTDPKQWFRQLEKIKKAKNWTRTQIIAQDPLLLTGRADSYWETTESTVTDWKTFKEKFSTDCGERKTVGERLTGAHAYHT